MNTTEHATSNTLPIIALGKQGLTASKIGYGCMGLSEGIYASVSEEQAEKVLLRAVELGVTHFDSAEIYGPFTNETLVGRVLAPFKDKVQIATKFAFDLEKGYVLNGKPDHIRKTVDAMLQRLQLDTIHLLYQHRPDPDTPVEETYGALGELVKEGKVRYLGASEFAPERLRKAHAVAPISVLQSEYSLFERHLEGEMWDTLNELGIGLVAYSPLGRGVLTNTIKSTADFEERDWRNKVPRNSGEALEHNASLAQRVADYAEKKGCTAGQLALAWVTARFETLSGGGIAIPGTTKINRLEENVGSLNVHLTAEEVAEIGALISPEEVIGDRYPTASMGMQYR